LWWRRFTEIIVAERYSRHYRYVEWVRIWEWVRIKRRFGNRIR
jgi:hypothetical protein